MDCARSPSSRHARALVILTAVLALALIAPAIAHAAPTYFSARRPAPSSITNNPRPWISVVVTDADGIRGARGTAYAMTLNGRSVPVGLYRFPGTGLRKIRLSYTPPTRLGEGRHTVRARIRDLRGQTAATTWTFTVDTIAPVTTLSGTLPTFPGTFIVGLNAADAGTGVRATFWQLNDGPVNQGAIVWGRLGLGTHTLKFWSTDRAGNREPTNTVTLVIVSSHTTPASPCSAAGCHRAGLADLHRGVGCDPCHGTAREPSSNCIECHGDYHAGTGHPAIESTSTPSCTAAACHGTDAVATHPDCSSCHGSDDPAILAVISAGDAKCESCHAPATVHPGAPAKHSLPEIGCTEAGCHSSGDVASIHADAEDLCFVCHKVGEPLTKDCVTCHTSTPPKHTPADHVSIPDTSTPSCSDAKCHGTSLLTTPQRRKHASCNSCHDGGVQWAKVIPGATQCETCHGDYPSIHGGAAAKHAWTNPVCAKAGCHPNDVADVHTTWASPPGCMDSCHAPGKTPSTNCAAAGCHPDGGFAAHSYTHQSIAGQFCVGSGCHAGTTVTDVDPGHVPGLCYCHSLADPVFNAAIEKGIAGQFVKCADCHKGADAPHKEAHEAIDKTDSAICISCHTADYYAVASRLGSADGTLVVPADLSSPYLEHRACSCHEYGEADGPKECVDCHAPHGFSQRVEPWDPQGTWFPVGGHNTTLYNVNGGAEHFGEDGIIVKNSHDETITQHWPLPDASVFWSQSNAVKKYLDPDFETSASISPTDSPEIAMAFRGFESTAEAVGAIRTDVGWGSVITCYDCHTELEGLEGPQGANEANYGLDPNFPDDWTKAELTSWDPTGMRGIDTTSAGPNPYYPTLGARIHTPDDMESTATVNLIYNDPSTSMTVYPGAFYNIGEPASQGYSMANPRPKRFLCMKCHKLVNSFQGIGIEGNARGNRSNALNFMGFSNYPHMEHHADMITGQGNCVSCHVAIPHGWKRPRLLVYESDPAPYKVQWVFAGMDSTTTAKDPNADLSNGNWGYIAPGPSNTLYRSLTATNAYDPAANKLYSSHLEKISASPNAHKELEPTPQAEFAHFVDDNAAADAFYAALGLPTLRWGEWDFTTNGVYWHADTSNNRGHYNNCSACTSASNRHDDTVAGVDTYGLNGPPVPYWK